MRATLKNWKPSARKVLFTRHFLPQKQRLDPNYPPRVTKRSRCHQPKSGLRLFPEEERGEAEARLSPSPSWEDFFFFFWLENVGLSYSHRPVPLGRALPLPRMRPYLSFLLSPGVEPFSPSCSAQTSTKQRSSGHITRTRKGISPFSVLTPELHS